MMYSSYICIQCGTMDCRPIKCCLNGNVLTTCPVCLVLKGFVQLPVNAAQPWWHISACITGIDVFVCSKTTLWGLVPLWMVLPSPPLPAVFLLVRWMAGWLDREKRVRGSLTWWTDYWVTLCIHLSLSHFQSQHLISSHMLSHWVRNQSFSLPLSLPIYLCRSLRHFILAIL